MAKVVLGGGIGGLSAAYYLSKQPKNQVQSIKLIESTGRLGGWIKTTKHESGAVFEQGPRTVRTVGDSGKNTLELVEELGLTSALRAITRNHPFAKKRMVYVNKQLHPLPTGIKGMFKTSPPFTRPIAFSIIKDLQEPKKEALDIDIYDFVERRFGKELADYALSPLICGICAGDAKEISVKFLMKTFFEMEQTHGSIIRGLIKNVIKLRKKDEYGNYVRPVGLYKTALREKWSVWSLENGLETLPLSIQNYLKDNDVAINLNKQCEKIDFENNKVLLTVNGQIEEAEYLYCSLPSKELAKLLEEKHGVLKEELSAIPFVTVGVVNLEYEGDIITNNDKGFGLLIPPNQKLPILGITFDSCIFPQEGRTVVTVMMGGKWFEQLFGDHPDDKTLLNTAVDQVKEILHINQEPKSSRVSVLRSCIPQYVVGHEARVQRIRQYITQHNLPLTLIGSSYDGVGLNDVIFSARKAVESTV